MEPVFQNIKPVSPNTITFQVSPTHVAYVNTLRRLMMTGVETVGFRADIKETGETTDVQILENSTPMTNEMLAHRIGLLPIHIKNPLDWTSDTANKYIFELDVTNNTDRPRDVTASDFTVLEIQSDSTSTGGGSSDSNSNSNSNSSSNSNSNSNSNNSNNSNANSSPNSAVKVPVPTARFFPPNPKTGDTCLIAILKGVMPGGKPEQIRIKAKATLGNGRENARFIPTSQAAYAYTRDTDQDRLKETFSNWLSDQKKITLESLETQTEKRDTLLREFKTLEINRCYLKDQNGEPYSFDFTVESAGVLEPKYIVKRACEAGIVLCNRFSAETLPEGTTVQPAAARLVGFDFLIPGQDHTLGHLLQAWLDANMVGKGEIDYVGYDIPHPLKDEMLVRIGVVDGKEETARKAFREAAMACSAMFQTWLQEWSNVTGESRVASSQPQGGPLAKPMRTMKRPISRPSPVPVTPPGMTPPGGTTPYLPEGYNFGNAPQVTAIPAVAPPSRGLLETPVAGKPPTLRRP
jgi:DNA-directed RNA polymerase subunit L/DNA-directed RNA polymerase alpha subunit